MTGGESALTIGRGGRLALWVFAVVVLAFVDVPLVIVTVNSFNSDRTFGWPPPSFTTMWWDLALHAQGPRDALVDLCQGRNRRHPDRTRARGPARARAHQVRLLRQARHQPVGDPADRTARHRHRRRSAVGDPEPAAAGLRHQRRPVHDHRRPRDVLHRRGLQQRRRAAAPDGRLPGGRLCGSRGATESDDAAGHVPADPLLTPWQGRCSRSG